VGRRVDLVEASILIAGGLAAGAVNTLAGGGSLLTVPLLVLIGLPGTVANGTNRFGILAQSVVAVWRFRAAGIEEWRAAASLLAPLGLGSLLGAYAIASVADETFNRLFGLVMIGLLVPTLRRPTPPESGRDDPESRLWSLPVRWAVFFSIGLYGGAFQAGVGIVMLVALSHAGFDLVRANALKLVVVGALTLVAFPVFLFKGQVAWIPALVIAVGFGAGGALGAKLAVVGGERLIRPVMAAAVVALAGRMLGLY
jgi:uncharacterized membrane protein YfcA